MDLIEKTEAIVERYTKKAAEISKLFDDRIERLERDELAPV